MKTFKQFLEAAVKPMANQHLNSEDAIEAALEHCRDAVAAFQRGDVTIYRGWHNKIPTGIVRPHTGTRKSENTSNFYTQLFDTNPENDLYPLRSKSLICTTDKEKAENYGNVSYVFPLDSVKIAVAPKADIWDIEAEFPQVDFGVGIYHMNEPIEFLLDYFEITNPTYEIFEEALDNLDEASFRTLFDEMFPAVKDYTSDDIDDFKTIWKNLYFYENQGVDLVNSVREIPSGSHEVWFSGDCVVLTQEEADLLLTF